jgi:phosphatidylserine decarboxylase
MIIHQYVERETLDVRTEKLYWDRVINFLYSRAREDAPFFFRIVTGPRISSVLGFLNYERFIGGRLLGNRRFLKTAGVNLEECLEDPLVLNSPRKIFERKIRYWECRPMPTPRGCVVSPADSRVLLGSFRGTSALFIKEKFFEYKQLLGIDKAAWLGAFRYGDYAVFRLTPDQYHYNHTPVAGVVKDYYELQGAYHSCNPNAVIRTVTPFSMNKRVVTVIDTDVPGGTGIGLVAMVEVVAFMIGDIMQCYSGERYDDPRTIEIGMELEKGCPKSLYRPGSSTDVLIFQANRVRFSDDIVRNLSDSRATSRFSIGFGRPLVETDVKVRSCIGAAR